MYMNRLYISLKFQTRLCKNKENQYKSTRYVENNKITKILTTYKGKEIKTLVLTRECWKNLSGT